MCCIQDNEPFYKETKVYRYSSEKGQPKVSFSGSVCELVCECWGKVGMLVSKFYCKCIGDSVANFRLIVVHAVGSSHKIIHSIN